MLIDTRELTDKQIITSDVCIIGAGAAGTTCAQEFLGTDLRVALLESGGKKAETRIQNLSKGEVSGDAYEPVEETHLRQLGGTANHWIIKMADKRNGFRYAPMSAIDFEQRDEIPNSGWPIGLADVEPYYVRAHEVCQIGPYGYEPGRYESDELKALDLNKQRVVTNNFSFGPTRVFTDEFPERFAQSANVDTYIHATVVELLTNEDGDAVKSALVRTFDGKEVYFEARQFVIASGGYCTPRLLLASRRKFPSGLGNRHDVVGRYYMDHSLVPSGNFYLHEPRFINSMGLYDLRREEGGIDVLGKLSLTDEVMRKEGLRNFTATLFPMPPIRDVNALLSLRSIVVSLKRWQLPSGLLGHVVNVIRGIRHLVRVLFQVMFRSAPLMPGFGQGGWSRLSDNHKKYHRLELLAFAEQSPNANNRITLLDEKDELGCPRMKAHFEWDQADLKSIARAQEIMAEELVSTGLGRFEPASENGKPVIGSLGLHHLMGTTRMSDDPKKGVVDRNCKVHDLDNLYIASSSVFTTGGHVNPTLTILALSIRVADELKKRL